MELQRLPVHAVGQDGKVSASRWRLKVMGLVEEPQALSLARIRSMPVSALTDDFRCEEGWEVKGQKWQGVLLKDIIALARPLPEAQVVAIGSGAFTINIPITQVLDDRILLAFRLNGEDLAREQGGPLRLVVSKGPCYSSIKWVRKMQLHAGEVPGTARAIALGRLGKKDPSSRLGLSTTPDPSSFG